MKTLPLNENAQPIFHGKKDIVRLSERKIDEMIGICRGVISDGIINQLEADFLLQWLTNNKKIADAWPANILFQRIKTMLQDNILDQNEKKELLSTIRQVTGETPITDNIDMSTRLPLTDPPPEVVFRDKNYCFTGSFVSGTRKQVEAAVVKQGGFIHKIPTLDTDYLVVGLIGSTDWIHSSYGRKIERAVEISEESDIKIISEDYWAQFI